MNIPGFTADASLCSSSNHYYVHGMYHRTEQNVYPADYIDQNCLSACIVNCGSVCAGTSGNAKAACINECAMDNSECYRICSRPGSPPSGGGGGVTTGGGGTTSSGCPTAFPVPSSPGPAGVCCCVGSFLFPFQRGWTCDFVLGQRVCIPTF